MKNPYAKDGKTASGNMTMNFDETVDYFQVKKAGTFAIDIIPFKIKSKNHPAVSCGERAVGELSHVLDYWIHRNVGPKKAMVVCPGQTYGKPCPICEEFDKIKKAKGWDAPETKDAAVSGMKAVRRVMYNVVDADDDEHKLQIFDVSWFLFTKELMDESDAKAKRDGKEFIDYAGLADPANAQTIEFRTSLEKGNGQEYCKFKSFQFLDRKDSHVHVRPISLDACIVLKDYDELSGMFYGKEEDEGAAQEEPIPVVLKQEKKEEEAPKRSRRDDPVEDEPLACPQAGLKFGKDFEKDKATEKICDPCPLYSQCRTEWRANWK